MQTTNKSVIETLVAVDAVRIPAVRLRGLKPSVIRFCFDDKLLGDYRGHGVMLTPKGVEAVKNACPEWQSVVRSSAEGVSP